jgi:hypothetical protein
MTNWIPDGAYFRLSRLFPFFRSLLRDAEDFVPALLSSGIIDFFPGSGFRNCLNSILVETVNFHWAIGFMRPKEVMSAPKVMLVIGNMVLCDELQPNLPPLFRLGLSVLRHERSPQSNIMKRILIILHHTKAGPQLVTSLINYLNEFVGNLGSDMLEELAKLDLFDAIAAFPAKAPMKSSLVATIGSFRQLCTIYRQFSHDLIRRNCQSSASSTGRFRVTRLIARYWTY